MRSLRIIQVILAITLLCCACLYGCCENPSNPPVRIVQESSFFSDFFVNEDSVQINCVLCLNNTTSEPLYVKISGDFTEDVQLGLLQEKTLYAVIPDEEQTSMIYVLPGEQTIEVAFIGTFGGVLQKTNRLLPDLKVLIIP